jgi:hypothetical protein
MGESRLLFLNHFTKMCISLLNIGVTDSPEKSNVKVTPLLRGGGNLTFLNFYPTAWLLSTLLRRTLVQLSATVLYDLQ